MASNKQDLKIEFVDAGEISKEQYESVVEMLATWIERDLQSNLQQTTDPDHEKHD